MMTRVLYRIADSLVTLRDIMDARRGCVGFYTKRTEAGDIYWPTSDRGRVAAKHELTAYPRKFGGYLVPASDFCRVHKQLRDGYCLIMEIGARL